MVTCKGKRVTQEKIVVKKQYAILNDSQARIEKQEGIAMCLIGLEVSNGLKDVSISLNGLIRCQILTIDQEKAIDQNRSESATKKGVVFIQRNLRIHTSLTCCQNFVR